MKKEEKKDNSEKRSPQDKQAEKKKNVKSKESEPFGISGKNNFAEKLGAAREEKNTKKIGDLGESRAKEHIRGYLQSCNQVCKRIQKIRGNKVRADFLVKYHDKDSEHIKQMLVEVKTHQQINNEKTLRHPIKQLEASSEGKQVSRKWLILIMDDGSASLIKM